MLGLGGAIENVIPPIPADTFVLFGGFLAAQGQANPWLVWVVVWVANVASAMGVYALALHYGQRFFKTTVGGWILKPQQLERIGGFYDRWGLLAIFGSRFLPAFRAVVPVFAGVSRMPWWKVLAPMAGASGLWYGLLVYLGTAAGANWDAITRTFSQYSKILLWAAIVLGVVVGVWWWRSRKSDER